jgi:hypothetical protein
MDSAKRMRLEAAGWKFGDTDDFLEMRDQERQVPDTQPRPRSFPPSSLISLLPLALFVGVLAIGLCSRDFPPAALVGTLLVALLFGGPALFVLGVYQAVRAKSSFLAASLNVILGAVYFMLALVIMKA